MRHLKRPHAHNKGGRDARPQPKHQTGEGSRNGPEPVLMEDSASRAATAETPRCRVSGGLGSRDPLIRWPGLLRGSGNRLRWQTCPLSPSLEGSKLKGQRSGSLGNGQARQLSLPDLEVSQDLGPGEGEKEPLLQASPGAGFQSVPQRPQWPHHHVLYKRGDRDTRTHRILPEPHTS